MEKESEIVEKYIALKKDAEECGITLQTEMDGFVFKDIPGSTGVVMFGNIHDVGVFIYGYSFAYKASF